MTNRDQTSKRLARIAKSGLALLALALLAPAVKAANVWDGGGEDDHWGSATNWDDDAVPTFPAALTFSGTTRLTPTNDLDNATNSITFASGAGAFTLSGNPITLNGNIAIAIGGSVTNNQTINLPLKLNASRTVSSAPVGGNFAPNKGILVINGEISGPYGLTSGGANYVQLNGTNTYTGDTVIASDSFSIGNANAFGSGKVIIGHTPGLQQIWTQTVGNKTVTNTVEIRTGRFITASYTVAGKAAGNLTLSGNVLLNQNTGNDFWCQTPLTLSGTVSGGNLNGLRMASGTVILQGQNTFTNHLVSNYAPSTPTFNINSDAAMGHTNNGVRALAGNLIFQTAAGTSITLAPSRTFVVSAGKTNTFDVPASSTLTVPGLISGHAIAKSGAGTLALPNANTYSGGTFLGGGILNITTNAALGADAAGLNFTGSATLQAGAADLIVPASRSIYLTNSGTYTAAFDAPANFTMSVASVVKGNLLTNSALSKTGAGTLILTGGSGGTPLGGMYTAGGKLSLQDGVWHVAPLLQADGAGFHVSGGATYEQTGGTNYLPVYSHICNYPSGSTLTSTGFLSGGVLSGMELMVGRRSSGVLTVTGTALLDLYSLKLGESTNYTSIVNLDGGVIACTHIATRDTNMPLRTTSILNLNGGTIRAKGVAGGLIGGYGSGTISYLKEVNVKGGGAVIDSQGFSVTIPQSLRHHPDLGDALDGGLTKLGSGTLTLAAPNTYNGVTRIEAGTLKVGDPFALAPASSVLVSSNAVFNVNGHYLLITGLGGSGTVISNNLLVVLQEVAPGDTNADGTLTLAAPPSMWGGTFLVDVTANGACDRVHVQGDLDLANFSLAVADTAALNKRQRYVIATYSGALTGPFGSDALPDRWHVKYDMAARQVYLSYDFGTLFMMR